MKRDIIRVPNANMQLPDSHHMRGATSRVMLLTLLAALFVSGCAFNKFEGIDTGRAGAECVRQCAGTYKGCAEEAVCKECYAVCVNNCPENAPASTPAASIAPSPAAVSGQPVK